MRLLIDFKIATVAALAGVACLRGAWQAEDYFSCRGLMAAGIMLILAGVFYLGHRLDK